MDGVGGLYDIGMFGAALKNCPLGMDGWMLLELEISHTIIYQVLLRLPTTPDRLGGAPGSAENSDRATWTTGPVYKVYYRLR